MKEIKEKIENQLHLVLGRVDKLLEDKDELNLKEALYCIDVLSRSVKQTSEEEKVSKIEISFKSEEECPSIQEREKRLSLKISES